MSKGNNAKTITIWRFRKVMQITGLNVMTYTSRYCIAVIILVLQLLCCFYPAYGKIRASFNEKFWNDMPKRVAVLPQFEGNQDAIELSGIVTSELMSLGFDVMERFALDMVLNEYKLSFKGRDSLGHKCLYQND